jgi:hypothetical protein
MFKDLRPVTDGPTWAYRSGDKLYRSRYVKFAVETPPVWGIGQTDVKFETSYRLVGLDVETVPILNKKLAQDIEKSVEQLIVGSWDLVDLSELKTMTLKSLYGASNLQGSAYDAITKVPFALGSLKGEFYSMVDFDQSEKTPTPTIKGPRVVKLIDRARERRNGEE